MVMLTALCTNVLFATLFIYLLLYINTSSFSLFSFKSMKPEPLEREREYLGINEERVSLWRTRPEKTKVQRTQRHGQLYPPKPLKSKPHAPTHTDTNAHAHCHALRLKTQTQSLASSYSYASSYYYYFTWNYYYYYQSITTTTTGAQISMSFIGFKKTE